MEHVGDEVDEFIGDVDILREPEFVRVDDDQDLILERDESGGNTESLAAWMGKGWVP